MTGFFDQIPAYIGGHLCPVDKLEVHRLGLKHPAISVFVMRQGKILMQRRALGKYHTPGLWTNTCCTHPHWGEAAAQCARRRLSEELGITGLSLRHAGVVEYRADVMGGLTEHEVVDLFTADAPADMAITLDPDEVAEIAWLEREDLLADLQARPERYTPWMRIYMRDHRSMIFAEAACS